MSQNNLLIKVATSVPDESCCLDWWPEIEKLDAPIILAQANNPKLSYTPEFQFKIWNYCPWCGAKRVERMKEMVDHAS